MTLQEKERVLRAILREMGDCVVAFSGGVDSALLLIIAGEELGVRVIGVTGRSESLAERELRDAVSFTESTNISHLVVDTFETQDPNYKLNPPNRCYYCKSELYETLRKLADERGFRWIADGFNKDDEGDWRPGRRAARELNVRSPLHEAGFTKNDVRELARSLRLDLWDKPALACLASRFPYGDEITPALLRQVDAAERAVLDLGVRNCRVRHHGEIARIEVGVEEMGLVLGERESLLRKLRVAGYRYITLDLSGYESGNFNYGVTES